MFCEECYVNVIGFNFLSKEGVFIFNGTCFDCTYFALGAWFEYDVFCEDILQVVPVDSPSFMQFEFVMSWPDWLPINS